MDEECWSYFCLSLRVDSPEILWWIGLLAPQRVLRQLQERMACQYKKAARCNVHVITKTFNKHLINLEYIKIHRLSFRRTYLAFDIQAILYIVRVRLTIPIYRDFTTIKFKHLKPSQGVYLIYDFSNNLSPRITVRPSKDWVIIIVSYFITRNHTKALFLSQQTICKTRPLPRRHFHAMNRYADNWFNGSPR